jgi:coenzyme F420 biosynthesis associated uncharacterized protein
MDRDPVAWDLAERVAVRVAGREPFSESYHYRTLQPDFDELTAQAEGLVAEATGLRSLAGPARARVTDRAGWVKANVASFRRLLRPLMERFGDRMAANPLAPVTRSIAGVELGTMLGWMSSRVLGQYDLLLVEDESPEDQDIVYYVGPNILSLEKRFGFPPREFRLWLALHEVTHRAQFTGIPWMHEHFTSLVDRSLGALDPDPKRFLVALLAGPEQHAVLQQVQGLMSLLEGHGDVTMDRAGATLIPSADRFSRVLRERRAQVRGPARVLQKVIGLEAKMRQYEQGERFIAAVEAEGGPALLDRAWEGPEWLPTLPEIREPDLWIARVREGATIAR